MDEAKIMHDSIVCCWDGGGSRSEGEHKSDTKHEWDE